MQDTWEAPLCAILCDAAVKLGKCDGHIEYACYYQTDYYNTAENPNPEIYWSGCAGVDKIDCDVDGEQLEGHLSCVVKKP